MATTDFIFISLEDGTIRISLDHGKEKKFEPDDIQGIGNYLAPHLGARTSLSSSVNHPHEYGFHRNFDIDKVLTAARLHAQKKTALLFSPLPVETAPDALEKLVGNKFPASVLFLRASKEGSDVLLTFREQDEFESFVTGMAYARSLARIQAHERRDVHLDLRKERDEALETLDEGGDTMVPFSTVEAVLKRAEAAEELLVVAKEALKWAKWLYDQKETKFTKNWGDPDVVKKMIKTALSKLKKVPNKP